MKTLIFSIFGCLAFSLSLAAREWTNQNGQVIEAEFVRLDEETVVIQKETKEFKVELSSLSEADQEFVKEQTKKVEEEKVVEGDAEFPLKLDQWVSGDQFEGTEHLGKPVVLHAWQAYCAACPPALEDFEKLAKRKRKLDAVFMIWHSHSKIEMAKSKSEALDLDLPVYHGRIIKWNDKFGKVVWPHVMILAPDGSPLYMGAADRKFEQALKEATQES